MIEKNNLPYIEEITQKTFESEPLTSEELSTLNINLYSDDINGGLHNIKLTEEEVEEITEQDKLAHEFIEITDEATELPQLKDQVMVKFSPEDLMILKESLEQFSLNPSDIKYIEEDLYTQQTYVRELRDKIDGFIDIYVKHRPYSPFFKSWVKRIGK